MIYIGNLTFLFKMGKALVWFGLGILFVAIVGLTFLVLRNGTLDDLLTGSFLALDNKEKTQTLNNSVEPLQESLIEERIVYANLLVKVFALRKHQASERINISKLIVDIDSLVSKIDNRALEIKWKQVVSCLAKLCSNGAFFDFLNTISQVGGNAIKNNELFYDVLLAREAWLEGDAIVIAKTIIRLDAKVEKVGDSRLLSTWKALLECDGQCELFEEKVFDMLSAIIALE